MIEFNSQDDYTLEYIKKLSAEMETFYKLNYLLDITDGEYVGKYDMYPGNYMIKNSISRVLLMFKKTLITINYLPYISQVHRRGRGMRNGNVNGNRYGQQYQDYTDVVNQIISNGLVRSGRFGGITHIFSSGVINGKVYKKANKFINKLGETFVKEMVQFINSKKILINKQVIFQTDAIDYSTCHHNLLDEVVMAMANAKFKYKDELYRFILERHNNGPYDLYRVYSILLNIIQEPDVSKLEKDNFYYYEYLDKTSREEFFISGEDYQPIQKTDKYGVYMDVHPDAWKWNKEDYEDMLRDPTNTLKIVNAFNENLTRVLKDNNDKIFILNNSINLVQNEKLIILKIEELKKNSELAVIVLDEVDQLLSLLKTGTKSPFDKFKNIKKNMVDVLNEYYYKILNIHHLIIERELIMKHKFNFKILKIENKLNNKKIEKIQFDIDRYDQLNIINERYLELRQEKNDLQSINTDNIIEMNEIKYLIEDSENELNDVKPLIQKRKNTIDTKLYELDTEMSTHRHNFIRRNDWGLGHKDTVDLDTFTASYGYY